MIPATVPIILASQSPRRANLLHQIGLIFSVVPSGIVEEMDPSSSYEANVQRLALHKAQDVAKSFPEGIVIGSDTIVVIDGKILGKPATREHAVEMLQLLSGKTHTVYTGFAIVDALTKRYYIDFEKTDVTFRSLTGSEIVSYCNSGSPLDKAGAYGIQDDFGAVFVERISGCYYTVVGFPLAKFYTALTTFCTELGYLKGTT